MILTGLLTLIYYMVLLLTSPLRLLDDVSVESGFGSSIATAGGYINNINNFFPISTLMTIFLIILGIELGIAVYKLIMWLLRRIPTQS